MNMRFLTTFLVAIFLFLVALPASALTQRDVDILIRAGLIPRENIAAARAAARDSGANQTTQTTQTVQTGQVASDENSATAAGTDNAGCLRLTTDIVEGISGTAVTSLQEFLRNQGHFTHPESTGYFGAVTRAAVQAFQSAQDIVSSGSPDTTGFGAVGPQTRDKIATLTCLGGTTSPEDGGDFFGHNLDDLFEYEVDFDYDTGVEDDFDFDYEPDFDYDPGTGFELDFGYEADVEYSVDDDFGGEPIFVKVSARNVNGDFIAGARGNRAVLVSGRTIEIEWESRNADVCRLSGDFPERNLQIPEDGSAQVFLVNPSFTVPEPTDRDNPYDFGFGGKPAFGLTVFCQQEGLYGATGSDLVIVHIDDGASE